MSLPKTLTPFIWYFVKKQKLGFIVVQLLALAWSLDNTAWPYAFKLLIDKITFFTGDKATIWHDIMPVLLFWGGLWLTIDVMFRIYGFIAARLFPRFEAAVRMAMFDYVADHSYNFFANHFAGNIANRISDMTQSATRVMQLIITLFIPALLALVIASAIFYSINYLFCLLLVGWVILHIGICLLGAKHCANLSEVHSNSRSFLNGKIVDAFTNIINIKLFARKNDENRYIGQYQQDEQQKSQSALTIVEKIKLLLSLSAFIIPGVLLTWYIIYSWQHNSIGIGDVVLIFNTTWNIQLLAWIAGNELPNLFKEIGVCQQALRVIQVEHEIVDSSNAGTLRITKGNIRFDQVSFHYIKQHRVFDNVSIDIAAGSKVGLVGFSGSGKSTFVNLIMRFFELEAGKISIDGTDIHDVTTNSLRSQIAMIPQNPSLFHRSLRDNIAYGKVDATENEIIEAARQSYSHDFICELPQGYDTLVGERGIKLSGGQRQRIAIARAVLANAAILILDEATSALDSVTEKYIQDALEDLMQHRTTIVVAHRLSTLAKMDRVLVFDKGNIIEDGTPSSLLAKNGHYAKMWQMQADGFLPKRNL